MKRMKNSLPQIKSRNWHLLLYFQHHESSGILSISITVEDSVESFWVIGVYKSADGREHFFSYAPLRSPKILTHFSATVSAQDRSHEGNSSFISAQGNALASEWSIRVKHIDLEAETLRLLMKIIFFAKGWAELGNSCKSLAMNKKKVYR